MVALRQSDPSAFRDEVRRRIIASLTKKQLSVLEELRTGTRYIALCCSRRAGKTKLLSKLLVLTLLDSGHNEAVFYIAWSLKIGRGLIWKEIEKTCQDYALDEYWRLSEHTCEIRTPEGAAFFILGLNKAKQSNMTRGFKARLMCVDESQDLEHLLASTLTAVAPALTDLRGVFIASGTPGYVPQGTWYEWCHGLVGGFKTFAWTLRDNEKFPRDIEETLREEREREGWTEDHPDYRREWLGEWVQDVSTLICEFLNERNSITELPDSYSRSWMHVIGIDYGWDDLATWVVVAANPYGPERIVMHAEGHEACDNDQAAAITRRLIQDYGARIVACDPSGGGKPFYETFNRRYGASMGITIKSANKLGKVDSVKVINTDLRTSRLQVLLPNAEPLARELRALRWADKESGEVLTSRTVRDDHFDGFRYAMVEIAPWVEREHPDDKKTQRAREEAAWRERCRIDPEAREIEERNRRARKSADEPWFARLR